MNETRLILQEMSLVLDKVDPDAVQNAALDIQQSPRIFVYGEGRSGLMGKSFAMRLMHLGTVVYVVGETITPSLQKGDLIVAVSGSGTTRSVVSIARKARELGSRVIAVTCDETSDLAQVADHIVRIPAATKHRLGGETPTSQPLGSLFDQCTHVWFDAVCMKVAQLKEVKNDAAFANHSNLE